jgi:very-short-patch-repair endonuclease
VDVAGYQADVYFPQFQLVIELDSRGFHLTPRGFENDAIRDAARLKLQIGTLRVTDTRYYNDPDGVIEDVLDLTIRRPRA